MPKTLQEQLDHVEREIEQHIEFDKTEKTRFDRESHLWTAEDRIEWQETQSDNAQTLRELFEVRDALRGQLGQQSRSRMLRQVEKEQEEALTESTKTPGARLCSREPR